ncbi:hypothetical protein OUZ56_001778 [Daphnia magna]|uniref:Uncharacterized protein n=1 Tax=Daphnia magna TaxID=35525 RepID=A0ABR0A3Q4_9CRUS|nr:hypothetical protein OUZ56_001778 [Daphnia magna]
MSDSPSSATAEKTSIPENEETAIPVTAETSTPVTEVNSTPVTGETAITKTEENSISVVEETPLPVPDETATPEREETSIPKTEQDVIPTTEMDNDESKEPELVPDPEDPAFNELRQLLDDFHVWKTITEMANATHGVIVFFVQLWALLISTMNVDIDPTGLLVGIYLVMLAALVKFEKVRSIDIARCLTFFAIILGVTLIILHSWSVYFCRNLCCYPIGTSAETLDISTGASCRWLTQRLNIDSLMVACGVGIVIFNGVLLYVFSFKTTTK